MICVAVTLSQYFITSGSGGSIEHYVKLNWKFCLMNFFFGFTVAFCVFVVVDQHRNYKASVTTALALLAMLPYVLWAFFVQSLFPNPTSLDYVHWIIREVALLSLPALVFALGFASLLEWSEKKARR